MDLTRRSPRVLGATGLVLALLGGPLTASAGGNPVLDSALAAERERLKNESVEEQVPLPSTVSLTPAVLYASVKNAVVLIRTDESLGAGFVVKNRRLVATAFHVIEDGGPITVYSRSGGEYDATVYTYDEEKDLAVLELGRDFEESEPLPLRTGGALGVGEPVVMVGHPYGDYADTVEDLEGLLTWTITSGIVGGISDRFIQTDAASSPGNSGGPVLDTYGRVLGVVSRRLDGAEGLTFSVPTRDLQRLLDNPGTPPDLPRQPRRRYGIGVSRMSTSEDLWMDGLYLVFDRSPKGLGPRWGIQLGYSTVNEVPEESGLFNFSEDLYWVQADVGLRWWSPFGGGSLDPFVALRSGWQVREELTLLGTYQQGCDPSGDEPCELTVTYRDDGSRGVQLFGVLGAAWNGNSGTVGAGALVNPFDTPRLRLAAWAALWF